MSQMPPEAGQATPRLRQASAGEAFRYDVWIISHPTYPEFRWAGRKPTAKKSGHLREC